MPSLVRSFLEGPERPACHDVAALDEGRILHDVAYQFGGINPIANKSEPRMGFREQLR